MASADQRLRGEGLVDVESGEEGWFSQVRYGGGMIGDDHVPVSADVTLRAEQSFSVWVIEKDFAYNVDVAACHNDVPRSSG